jgi:hypothetical protein
MTLLEKQLTLHPSPIPSLFFPLPSPFANFRPHANMESFPAKKAKQNLRQLTHDDSDVIRKLKTAFEKHLKLKNQLQREVEKELKKVTNTLSVLWLMLLRS